MLLLVNLLLITSQLVISKESKDKTQIYQPGARPLSLGENLDYDKEITDSKQKIAKTKSSHSEEEQITDNLDSKTQETLTSSKETTDDSFSDTESPPLNLKSVAKKNKQSSSHQIDQQDNSGNSDAVLQPFRSYLILASKVIRPGRPYFITISLKNVEESMPITVVIQRDGNNTLKNTISVKEGKPVKLRFEIPEDFKDGSYKLIAFGQDINHKYVVLNQTDLEFQSKIASVFIQTDKPAYKRGQLIRFRVIMTDPDLKPYTKPVTVYITCPLNLRTAEWEHVSEISGVISREFHLPNETVVGIWRINVDVEDETISQPLQFIEDDGVLPKFEIVITSPPYVLWDKKSSFPVKITAKYPNDMPVNGSLELTIRTKHEYGEQVKQIANLINGEANIDIRCEFINFPEYLEEFPYILIANVSDKISKTYYTASTPLTMFRDKYRVAIVPSSNSFKPGLKFQLWVKLELFDGGFLPDEDVKINISYGFKRFEDKTWKRGIYPVPPIGLVDLDLYPDEKTDMIYVKVDFQGFQRELKITKKVLSKAQKYIHLTSDSPQYGAGDKAILSINSTLKLANINLVVFARNNILSTGLVNMKNRKQANVNLPITEAMIPSTFIAVYYITSEGELLADSINITVGGPFPNNVSVHFYEKDGSAIDPENQMIPPGTEILVSGMTSPNSFVFINIMDEGAYLLKPEDFFSVNKLYLELDAYNGRKKRVNQNLYSDDRSADACKILMEAGFAVITNGCELQQVEEYPDNSNEKNEDLMQPSFSTTEVFGSSLKQKIKSKIKTRRNFPETWLWTNTVAGPDGKFENISVIPDTMTTWVASAFSMNPLNGLGLMEYPAKVHVAKSFFIVLNLPFSGKRNEIVKFNVLIFHKAEEPYMVEVKLDKSDYFQIPQTTEESLNSRKKIIQPGSYGRVDFSIIPTVIGTIPIRVSALSSVGKDAEERKIIIKPEGVTHFKNESAIIHFGKKNQVTNKFNVNLPKDYIADSDVVIVSIIANGFGPPLKHIEKAFITIDKDSEWFKEPYHLSQNLATFRYLDITSQFPSNFHITKYLDLLNEDYKNLLKLRQTDGAFQYQYNADTLMTSFAIRYLTELKQYIYVDPEIIESAIKWLTSKQSLDGSYGLFRMHEQESIDKIVDIKTTDSDIFISADVILSLIKAEVPLDKPEIAKTIEYLEKQVRNDSLLLLNNDLLLAKLAYIFSLVKSSKFDDAVQLLKVKVNLEQITTDYLHFGNSLIYSYLIPLFINSGEVGKALMFSKKLAATFQFESLQNWEKVRVLEAMTLVAEYTYNPETEMEVKIKAGNQFSAQMSFNYENINVDQYMEIPHIGNADHIEVSAEGHGSFLVLLEWQYNMAEDEHNSNTHGFYGISVTPSFKGKKFLVLSICYSVTSNRDSFGRTIINAEFPEGYEPYQIDSLVKDPLVSITETHEHNVFIFVNLLNAEGNCFEVKALMKNGSKKFSDIPVYIFDFTNPDSTIVSTSYSSPLENSKQS